MAYALATALFGGSTPMMSTWLIEITGNKAAPGLWMAFAGTCGLIATVAIYSQKMRGYQGSTVGLTERLVFACIIAHPLR